MPLLFVEAQSPVPVTVAQPPIMPLQVGSTLLVTPAVGKLMDAPAARLTVPLRVSVLPEATAHAWYPLASEILQPKVALMVEALMSMPDVPLVSVSPLPMLMGSVAPAFTLMPSQLGVPEFNVNPAPSEPVSHTATSLDAGATEPLQLAPAVKSVPEPAFVMLAAVAGNVNKIARPQTLAAMVDWR